jgi:hypothetical protein
MQSSRTEELLRRLKAQERELQTVLEETADDNAHHLQHALDAIQRAIRDVEERFRAY